MASHAKIFHRDSAGTDAFTFDATMALPLADIKILRTLVAPFAKGATQETEEERTARVIARAGGDYLKKAIKRVKLFARAQNPKIKLPKDGSKSTKSLDKMDYLSRVLAIAETVLEVQVLIAAEAAGAETTTASIDDGWGLPIARHSQQESHQTGQAPECSGCVG